MGDWSDESYKKFCTCGGMRVNGRCSSCGSTTGYSADRERGQPKEPENGGGGLCLIMLIGMLSILVAAFLSVGGW